MNIEQALHKISAKDGDIVFFDIGAVDTNAIEKLCANPPAHLPSVTFISVTLRHGQSCEDAVFAMSKMELELLISEKANG